MKVVFPLIWTPTEVTVAEIDDVFSPSRPFPIISQFISRKHLFAYLGFMVAAIDSTEVVFSGFQIIEISS